MSCLNPVTILLYKGTEKEQYQRVRCRQCEDCKQSMRSAAFVRLKAELDYCYKNHGMAFFFTLTFADEYVPFKFHRMCFDKRMVQVWMQQFRQELRRKYGYNVKYFLVSELGHVGTHRPHHHGMLFLYKSDKYQLKSWRVGGKNHYKIPVLPLSFARMLSSLWTYGRCDIQEYDPSKGGIQYIAKYISKFDEEEKLYLDIITSIKMKYHHGDPEFASYYYAKVFPWLYNFMCRYCPFTMISKGLGSSLVIDDEKLYANDNICIDGFNYSIPRYYSDRFVRKEIKAAQEFVTHDNDLSDCERYYTFDVLKDRPSYRRIEGMGIEPYLKHIYHTELHPADYVPNDKPSSKVLEKYAVRDLSGRLLYYLPMPIYERKFKYDGTPYMKILYPKQSEVSQLSQKRKDYRYWHLLSEIENRYFNLPPLLQDSCSVDVPKVLKESAEHLGNFDESMALTWFGVNLLSELEELEQVASSWRAESRLQKMELKRKEKCERNAFYAKRPLTWNEYARKSKYMSNSLKFK